MVLLNHRKQKELEMRWFILLWSIVLICLVFLRGEIIRAVLSFGIGVFVGFLVDCLGVGYLKQWRYPRQEFLKKEYFIIVVPAWGVFGATINLLWNWLGVTEIASFIIITVSLLLVHELPNFKTKSWEYHASMWLVCLGWFPLILVLRVLFVIFS